MIAILKGLVSCLVHLTPGKETLLRLGAVCPPLLKSRLFCRLMAFILSRLSHPILIVTNLGMRSRYRVQLPSTVGRVLLFGTPNNYVGERGALFLASSLASDCNAFLDIGANHGYFTFFLANALGSKYPIHFFEPHEGLFREVMNNVSLNGLKSVKGFQVAIGAVCGKSKFYLNLSDDVSSSLKTTFRGSHKTAEVEVPITTFNEFVRHTQLQNLLVKVDIESAEEDFIQGAEAEAERMRYLIIEVLGPAVQQGFVSAAIRRLGMEAYYINDFSLEHSTDGTFSYIPPQYNWLFCRLSAEQLAKRLQGTPFSVTVGVT